MVEESDITGMQEALRNTQASRSVAIPEEILERVSALCLPLPEVTVRLDRSRTEARWSFCLLVARKGPNGESVPLVVLRTDADERELPLSVGHPFFAPRAPRDRIGVLLTEHTDWEEIAELVIESYRILAPKKLVALLDRSCPKS